MIILPSLVASGDVTRLEARAARHPVLVTHKASDWDFECAGCGSETPVGSVVYTLRNTTLPMGFCTPCARSLKSQFTRLVK